jgi:hypothetical protein
MRDARETAWNWTLFAICVGASLFLAVVIGGQIK